MAELTTYTRANREFFAKGAGPSKAEWCEWIERGIIRGKIIAGKPYIDANWFAANDCFSEPAKAGTTAMDLLS